MDFKVQELPLGSEDLFLRKGSHKAKAVSRRAQYVAQESPGLEYFAGEPEKESVVALPTNAMAAKDYTLIQQGAEARLFTGSFQGRPTVIKERFCKKYRQPELDARLRQQRTLAEVRCNRVCRSNGIDTPAIFLVDPLSCKIFMELIPGITLRQFIGELDLKKPEDLEQALEAASVIGEVVAQVHNAGLIHGDLTTSNLMLRGGDLKAPVVIDFGLSYQGNDIEDQAVDLYVLERAFLSTHANSEAVFKRVLEVYSQKRTNDKGTLSQLDAVRLRGRKRDAIG